MSQSQTSSASATPYPATGCGAVIPSEEVDRSCRYPLLFLALSSTGWLLLATVLNFLATLKFHKPDILADMGWLTYGRVHPAGMNCLIYGFAIQAGLALVLWVFADLGKTKLAYAPLTVVGWLLWNVGITLGVAGILYGDSTGYEWLEMPRYGVAFALVGYMLIALSALATFHLRRVRTLSISHWFMVSALFWFPWIYTTAAYLLLIGTPVRGVLQYNVDSWYFNNLTNIVLGFIGLGTAFYFVPTISKRPLNNFYTGIFIFVALITFGTWSRIPAGTPLPAWFSAYGALGALTTIAPALAVLYVVFSTRCRCSELSVEHRYIQRFVVFGSLAYAASTLISAVNSTFWFSEVTHFTWFVPANNLLFIYGFAVMSIFCGLYYVLPRVLGGTFPSTKLIVIHFFLAAAGIFFYAVPLLVGGITQGHGLNNASVPFITVMTQTLMPLRASTLGDLLMAAGHLAFALNLFGLVFETISDTATTTVEELTRVEVAS